VLVGNVVVGAAVVVGTAVVVGAADVVGSAVEVVAAEVVAVAVAGVASGTSAGELSMLAATVAAGVLAGGDDSSVCWSGADEHAHRRTAKATTVDLCRLLFIPRDCRTSTARQLIRVLRMTVDDPIGQQHEELVERPDVGRIFETRRRVRLGDCSPGGRMRLDACARFLQDIANDDSRDAGSPNPTAWVARRTVIRVERFPAYLDKVRLATWCSGIGPRWAERRYEVIVEPDDGGGSQTAGRIEASTLWVHVDMATMKPIPVPEGFAEQFAAAARGRVVKARLHLPQRPSREDVERVRWPLRFVDFDVLGHVNNSVYWAMVEEQLAARRELRAPLTITLEHHAGIDPGDEVTLTTATNDRGFDLWVAADDGRVAAVVSATG